MIFDKFFVEAFFFVKVKLFPLQVELLKWSKITPDN